MNYKSKLKAIQKDDFRIYTSVIRMAETDDEFICANDVILIHGGTSNLSDGDSVEQLERIAEIIEDVNPLCKIITSSILPRKNDRLANQLIKQTNQSLQQLCVSKSYSFMENTGRVLKNGVPDPTLYKDNIQFNAKSRKVFGETISHQLRYLLNLTIPPVQTSAVEEQDFQSGRLPGRRTTNNKNSNNKRRNNNNGNNNRNNNNGNNNRNNNNGNNSNRNNNANSSNNKRNNKGNNNWNNNNSSNNRNNNNSNNYNRNNNRNNNNNWNNSYNNNNRNNNNNNNRSNNNSWNGMMLMRMPFLPPWFHQNGDQMNMTNP